MTYADVSTMVEGLIDAEHFDHGDYNPIFSSRKQFFIRGLEALQRRIPGVDNNLRAHFADRPECRPPKDALSGAMSGKPMTLSAACQLKCAFDALAADSSPASETLRNAFTQGSPPRLFSIGDRAVVPSIYHIRPDLLTKARDHLGWKRLQASRWVYGTFFSAPRHQHLFLDLETGFIKNNENGTMGGYKVTRFLAEHIFNVMREGFIHVTGDREATWFSVFSSQPDAGPKAGDNTSALPLGKGNLLASLPQPSRAGRTADPLAAE